MDFHIGLILKGGVNLDSQDFLFQTTRSMANFKLKTTTDVCKFSSTRAKLKQPPFLILVIVTISKHLGECKQLTNGVLQVKSVKIRIKKTCLVNDYKMRGKSECLMNKEVIMTKFIYDLAVVSIVYNAQQHYGGLAKCLNTKSWQNCDTAGTSDVIHERNS